MNIPVSIVWEIALVVLGFVFGTLWGHHAQIGKRVTYSECADKRHNCPCTKAIEDIRGDIHKLHPHQKG